MTETSQQSAASPRVERKTVRIALCGNPNAGKSTIFNHLTGLRQKVANYPGVTVEAHSGVFTLDSNPEAEFEVIDVPGCYSLSAISPDEFIAAQSIIGRRPDGSLLPPDLVVVVLDATTLERSLYLLAQISQAGLPTIAVLNQVDVAERRRLRINSAKLSEKLGIPVVSAVASKGRGMERLREIISDYSLATRMEPLYHFSSETESWVSRHSGKSDSLTRPELLRALFDRGGPAEKQFARTADADQMAELNALRSQLADKHRGLQFAEAYPLALAMNKIAGEVRLQLPDRGEPKTQKIDAIVLHRIWGPLLLLAIMAFMFQAIFTWAEPLMDLIDSAVASVGAAVGSALPGGAFNSLLVDGVIGGVGSVLVFLPQIVILFLFLGFLEDSGYLPRAAFIVDRLFRWCGLSGRSFVPLLSSFACAIPGIMSTRVIESPRQRLLTILVAPLMSCSARLPVYTVMIAAFIPYESFGVVNSRGLTLIALYSLGIVVAILVSLILKSTALKTQSESFVMELPTFKAPTISGVWIRTSLAAKAFIKRAGTIIFAITIVIWALSYYPRSSESADAIDRKITEAREVIQKRLSERATALGPGVTVENFDEASQVAFDNADGDSRAIVQFSIDMFNNVRRVGDSIITEMERERSAVYLRESYFGQMGRALEPLFKPLGWDWKITMAALASFPAREVIIATLGTIYNLGSETDESSPSLIQKLQAATWDDGERAGEKVFNPAVALSIMVFFALCCQCGATLAVIRRETNSWKWPVFTFTYMTALAYVAALATYNLFSAWLA